MNYQDSISFIIEPTDLICLRTEKMDWATFEKTTGFDLDIVDWDIPGPTDSSD